MLLSTLFFPSVSLFFEAAVTLPFLPSRNHLVDEERRVQFCLVWVHVLYFFQYFDTVDAENVQPLKTCAACPHQRSGRKPTNLGSVGKTDACVHVFVCTEKLRRREEVSDAGEEKVIEPNTCVHLNSSFS